MANQFIGLHMRVVLRDPPGYQLTATVRDVEAGSCLTLTNGKCSWRVLMKGSTNIDDQSSLLGPRSGILK